MENYFSKWHKNEYISIMKFVAHPRNIFKYPINNSYKVIKIINSFKGKERKKVLESHIMKV